MRAYDLQPFQVGGGSDWMSEDRFEVAAKAEDGFAGGDDEIRAMLQSLLADRFALMVRADSKEMPVYALVLARADGKLGEQLQPSKIDCAQLRARRQRTAIPIASYRCPAFRRCQAPTAGHRSSPPCRSSSGCDCNRIARPFVLTIVSAQKPVE
jgi:uncharacterized protein (TIGR03435 family)